MSEHAESRRAFLKCAALLGGSVGASQIPAAWSGVAEAARGRVNRVA